MIEQAKYWRKDLLRIAIKLEKRYRQQRWSKITEYMSEKEIFIGFFIVRKLMESGHVICGLTTKSYEVFSSPHSEPIDLWKNKSAFLNDYNPTMGILDSLSIKDLCNQFIHSYYISFFVPLGRELVGIYFCSDRQRKKSIYYVQLVKVLEIFLSIGINSPRLLELTFDKGKCYTNIEDILQSINKLNA